MEFMAIRVVEFSIGGKKLEIFLLKNQHTQRKLLNSEFGINGELSKIGHNFSNNFFFLNLFYQRMSKTKNVLLNWYSLMKKKLRKIQMIFDIQIDFESQILALFDSSALIQNSKFNNFL
jgi:hypothetical protein